MATITEYRLTPVQFDAEAIGSTSTLRDVEQLQRDGESFELYRVASNDVAETGYVVYAPQAGRAGVAWGSESQWTDCSSAEDAVERFLGLDGKELVN